MSAILLWGFAALVVIWILSLIPGVQLVVKPLIESVFAIGAWTLEHSSNWVIYFFKRLWKAHVSFFTHLTHKPEDLDRSIIVRRKNGEDV